MSLQGILQQLLQSAQQTKNTRSLGGFTGGALTGGALALLLGNKKVRRLGGKMATYGSLAALGAVAYKAYEDWQKKEASTKSTQNTQNTQNAQNAQTFVQLAAPELENHSRLLLTAMISAAKADGHIDEQEQALLDLEFQKLDASETEKQWLSTQLSGPADPITIARLVSSPEQAAEVYLASVLITGVDSFMERAYLDELARQLELEPSLKDHLEKTALES